MTWCSSSGPAPPRAHRVFGSRGSVASASAGDHRRRPAARRPRCAPASGARHHHSGTTRRECRPHQCAGPRHHRHRGLATAFPRLTLRGRSASIPRRHRGLTPLPGRSAGRRSASPADIAPPPGCMPADTTPRPEQRPGSCDMDPFPIELPLSARVEARRAGAIYEKSPRADLDPEPGLRIPNMFDAAIAGTFRGLYVQGGTSAIRPHPAFEAALRGHGPRRRQDLFLNETARFAHVFPGTSFLGEGRHLHQRRAAPQPGAAGHATGSGQGQMADPCDIATGDGASMDLRPPSEIMDEIAATTPTFAGSALRQLDAGARSVAGQRPAPGDPDHAHRRFVPRQGRLIRDPWCPDDRALDPPVPLLPTTGRISASTTSAPRPGAPRTSGTRPTSLNHPRRRNCGHRDGDLELAVPGRRPPRCEPRVRPDAPVSSTPPSTTRHRRQCGRRRSDWATNCPNTR